MAKKKEPTVEDALGIFKGVLGRAGIESLQRENRFMYGRNSNNASVVIETGDSLWDAVMDDPDLKEKITELNPSNDFSKRVELMMQIVSTSKPAGWVEIDPDVLYKGKIIRINVSGFEYDVTINRDTLPLKLRKAEYNNIKYQVRLVDNPTLSIRKEFKQLPDGCDFIMTRVFQIV